MDVEKYTSGKVYRVFEWAFKLIIWNLLSLLIICSAAAIPFLCFFNIQDDCAINLVEVITVDNQEQIIITQNNGTKTNIGNRQIYGEIEEVIEKDNKIYLYIDNIEIKINNTENIRNIQSAKFENCELIIEAYLDNYNLGNIYESEVDLESCKIDSYQSVVICYENGVFVNYGQKVDTKATISGILVIIGLILGLFAFIPCFITTFMMIKIYAEDGSAQTLLLYFYKLWDNFKSIYKLELIIVPLISIMIYGIYNYYLIISNLENPSFFFSMSYNIILISLICMLLFILNLPMTIGYFRMKTYTILRFTFAMTFRNFLYSLLYVIILLAPLFLCLLNNFFLPIWFLVGLSLPLLIMYFVSSKKYHKLVYDFNSYKENDDIYDLGGNKE